MDLNVKNMHSPLDSLIIFYLSPKEKSITEYKVINKVIYERFHNLIEPYTLKYVYLNINTFLINVAMIAVQILEIFNSIPNNFELLNLRIQETPPSD